MIRKLVLLPGMDGTGELFSSFANALSQMLEVETVRYHVDQCLSYAELMRLVSAACQISEPFAILAESFSTPLAILYAATKPPNLQGVILCAGFARSPVRGWKRILASLLAPILFRLPLPDFASRHWLVGSGATSMLLAAVKASISSVKPQVLSARLRAILACDVRTELTRVAVPILYVKAEQDQLVHKLCLDEIRQVKPLIEVATIAGPHLILQRKPEQSAEIISQFIQRLLLPPTTEN